MRVLILSDIHSNVEALRSVIKDAEQRGGFQSVWQLGDLVGYGPDPRECIDLLRDLEAQGVAGNHDLASTGRLSLEAFNVYAAAASRWNTAQLDEDQVAYLESFPIKAELNGITAVHGSPRDPVWEYVVTPASAAANFLHFDTARCICGHTHIPFLCTPSGDSAEFRQFPLDTRVALGDGRMIFNPGSVGQPRDGDPRASYVVLHTDDDTVSHHRVEYEIPKTQEKMSERGLPRYLIDRLPLGR